MVTVRTSLKKLREFIGDLENGTANSEVYKGIKKILEDSLKKNVFVQSHAEVYEIPTQNDLISLIQQGGRSHRPGQPQKATYNKEYLEKKRRMGLGPHRYKNQGFYEGTQVNRKTRGIEMRTPIESVTDPKTGYPYGVIHESKKSVLKYAFLSSWQEIYNHIINKYKEMLS